MGKSICFSKMEAAGNDYIYVYASQYPVTDPVTTAIQWSNRHSGIGSDGLVLIEKSMDGDADFSMRIFNADGSEARMCGNAACCVGRYVYEKGLTNHTIVRLSTRSGIKILRLEVAEGHVQKVSVDMQEPSLDAPELFRPPSSGMLHADGKSFKGTFVSMGNPHFVVMTDNIELIDLSHDGRLLSIHEAFPEGCNIEFVEYLGNDEVRMRVWERGSGITMACGTGACAVAVASVMHRRTGRTVRIHADGGCMEVEWRAADNHLLLTSPARFVFEGTAFLLNEK